MPPELRAPPRMALVPPAELSFRLVSEPAAGTGGATEAVSYTVEYARHPDFRDPQKLESPESYAPGEVAELTPAELEAGKTYYWRARAQTNSETSEFSDTRSFTVDAERRHRAWSQRSGWQWEKGQLHGTRVDGDAVTVGFETSQWAEPFYNFNPDDAEDDQIYPSEPPNGAALQVQRRDSNFEGIDCNCGAEIAQDGELRLWDYDGSGGVRVTAPTILRSDDGYRQIKLKFRREPSDGEGGVLDQIGQDIGGQVSTRNPVFIATQAANGAWGSVVVLTESESVGASADGGWKREVKYLARDVSTGALELRAFDNPVDWYPGEEHELTLVSNAQAQRTTVYWGDERLRPAVRFLAADEVDDGGPIKLHVSTNGININNLFELAPSVGDSVAEMYFEYWAPHDPIETEVHYEGPYIDAHQAPAGATHWAKLVGRDSSGERVETLFKAYKENGVWTEWLKADELAERPLAVYSEIKPRVVLRLSDAPPVPTLSSWDVTWGGPCLNEPDGTECSDGNACTGPGTCEQGVCMSGPQVPCAQPPEPCVETICDPTNGCVEQELSDVPCDDGNPCTNNDQCRDGECTGEEKECEPDQCHASAFCNPETGECDFEPAPNGTPCNDADGCTKEDSCFAGQCAGTPVMCTTDDPCEEGMCEALGPNDYECNYRQAPKDTLCDDDNPCTKAHCTSDGKCRAESAPDVCEPATAVRFLPGEFSAQAGQHVSLTVQAVDAQGRPKHQQLDFCVALLPGSGGTPTAYVKPPTNAPESAHIQVERKPGRLCAHTYAASGTARLRVSDTLPEEVTLRLTSDTSPAATPDDVAIARFHPGEPDHLRIVPLEPHTPACGLGTAVVEAVDEFGNRIAPNSSEDNTATSQTGIDVELSVDGPEGAQLVGTTLQTDASLPAPAVTGKLVDGWASVRFTGNTPGDLILRAKSEPLSAEAMSERLAITDAAPAVETSELVVSNDAGGLPAGDDAPLPLQLQVVDSCGNPLGDTQVTWRTSAGRLQNVQATGEGRYAAELVASQEACGQTARVEAFADGRRVAEPLDIELDCPAWQTSTPEAGCAASRGRWLALLLGASLWRRRRRGA